MKKIITNTETIYIDIDELYGGWMATTEGEPICLNMLEEAGAEEEIERIESIIDEYPAEDVTLEDECYVDEWLKMFGIDKIK